MSKGNFLGTIINMKSNKTTRIVSGHDLSVLRPKHVGKWVALSSNYKKLLAIGETLSAVLKKTGPVPGKVIIKVLPNLGYAPNAN